jgi:hypothetical protein
MVLALGNNALHRTHSRRALRFLRSLLSLRAEERER